MVFLSSVMSMRRRALLFQWHVLFGCVLLSLSFLISANAETTNVLPQGARIVVIGGALTEIVYALGADGQMIGRDTTSTYPERARALADVGYMRSLSPEGVLSLEPQGIVLIEGSGPPQTLEVLQKASVPMVVIPEVFSRDGVKEKIRLVGQALHRDNEAKALIASVERDFAKTDDVLQKIRMKKRVLFVLSLQNGRVMAAGTDTAANSIIELAGGQNAVTGYSGYKLLNDEALIESAPDIILMMRNGGQPLAKEDILALPAVRLTPAGQNSAIEQLDGLYLLGFGPRTAKAARTLAGLLYPDEVRADER